MEVVYVPPQDSPHYRPGDDTLRKTKSTTSEVNRIMSWNYDIAKTDATRSPYSGPRTILTHRPRYIDSDDDPIILRRSVTSSTIIEGPPLYSTSPSVAASKVDSGMSPSSAGMYSFLGAAVGAAAGAAMTYGMMNKDRSHAPRQEFAHDGGLASSLPRRSTFPEPKVNFVSAAPQYHYHYEAAPPPLPGQRYVELERTVEKIRYPEDYAGAGHFSHPPAYVARYSQVGAPSSKKGDLLDDTKSRHSLSSSKYRGDRVLRETPAVAHVPLLLTEAEHRSHVGSSASRHNSYAGSKYASNAKPPPAAPNPPPSVSASRRPSYNNTDRDSYVSARSHRSTSTLRPDPVPETETYGSYPPVSGSTRSSRTGGRVKSSSSARGRDLDEVAARDRSQSRASTKFERQFPMPNNPVARHYALPPSHDGRSLYSAHEIPLPQSSIGGKSHRSSSGRKSHHKSSSREPQLLTRSALGDNDRATWEEWDDDDDDDAVSLAPSDSISCVGSKKSSRSRR